MLRKVLASHDLLQHFSVISYSDEVGYRKPDQEMFRRTLEAAGAGAAEAALPGLLLPARDLRRAGGPA